MAILTEKFDISTVGYTDMLDITNRVQNIVLNSAIKEGSVMVYVTGSTSSVTTIQLEDGVSQEFLQAWEKIVPENNDYLHKQKGHEGNVTAHIRATIIGNSVQLPLVDGHILLGTWQQVVLVDFDSMPGKKTIVVQIVY